VPEEIKKIIKEQNQKEKLKSSDFVVEKEFREKEKVSEDLKNVPESFSEKKNISDDKITVSSSAHQSVVSEYTQIENILEEDLEEIYFSLPPEKQKEFKTKGEETAKKISLALQKTKIKVNQIIKLIKNWLKLIPGVNKFFLEQEAKIKADKIIELKRKNNWYNN